MPVELRTITAEEFPAFARAGEASFGAIAKDEDAARELPLMELDRSVAGVDDGAFVATSAAFSVALRAPAGDVPTCFVSWVSVRRDHRRQGLLSGMMGRLLDQARERGEPLAALFASEGAIYGRYGFGVADRIALTTVERRRSAFRPGAPSGTPVRALTVEDARAAFPGVYAAARAGYTGMPSRRDVWFDYSVLADPPAAQEGAGPKEMYLAEGSDGPEGYAVWRLRPGPEQAVPDGVVDLTELVATTPAAEAALWRTVLDVDLAERVRCWRRPLHDPLMGLLADPRAARREVLDGLWLRFVDLPAALAARGWTGSDRLVLEVADAFRHDQGGRWSLEVVEGSGACTRTAAEPDLAVDTEALASTYFGDTRPPVLRAAGRLVERTPGATARLDALLGICPQPWSPEDF